MSFQPRISIGLPVFNGANYLKQAIDSLLAQTFTAFELIISDNGSTDDTEKICQSYVRKDPRIRYFRSQSNKGVTWNFNRVFELALFDFFMWASHDDYWYSGYLQACFDVIQRSESLVLVGTACNCVDAKTKAMMMRYPGVDTVGLAPKERFKYYKEAVNRPGTDVNAIFYGLYRRRALAELMPIKKMMAGDHILLLELSLAGEFFTVESDLMVKRYGGFSLNIANVVRALEIKNPFIIRFPHLAREINIQQVIFRTDRLKWFEKAVLSFWSLLNFFCCAFVNRTGWHKKTDVK